MVMEGLGGTIGPAAAVGESLGTGTGEGGERATAAGNAMRPPRVSPDMSVATLASFKAFGY